MENSEEAYNKGPDQILPADSRITWKRDGRTTIEMGPSGFAALPPVSIPTILIQSAKDYPDKIALAGVEKSEKWTYKEYLQDVRICAKAFIKLGLNRHYTVCILGYNSPQWVISYMGTIFAGGIANGIYLTNSPEACFHSIDNSKGQIVIVQDEVQLKKIQEIRHRLPLLKAVVLIEGIPPSDGTITWKQLMEIGEAESDDNLEQRLSSIAVNECCAIIYTSGTIGNPKGTMMSHDALTISIRSFKKHINDVYKTDSTIMSYLPLSHIAGMGFDIIYGTMIGVSICFADKNALKSTFVQNLQRIRPTSLMAVPRVYEKIREGLQQAEEKSGVLKQSLFSWARYHALKHNVDKINGTPSNTWSYWLASNLVLKRLRAALGLSRCEHIYCGAAPLSFETRMFFLSLDIPIFDIFGLSETVVVSAVAEKPSGFKFDSNGTPLDGTLIKIDNPDADGNGEILIKSRSVYMGYLDEPEKTLESRTEDGYFRSGDVGRLDDDKNLYITGRKKEIIITAGGENVPPVVIEELIKGELHFISNAMVVGDQRKYLTVLLTLKTEVNSETNMPLDKLMPVTQTFLDSLHLSDVCTVTDVLKSGPDAKIMTAIQKGIGEVNKKAISNAQKVQKFAILPKDFSLPTGELGPTLKLKRPFVAKKYESIIDDLYK